MVPVCLEDDAGGVVTLEVYFAGRKEESRYVVVGDQAIC